MKTYVGTPGGPVDLASAANNGRGPLEIARAGAGRTANSAATGADTTVGFVATNAGTCCVAGGQHEEIAIWPHSPCIAAQQAIGVAVFASPKAHCTIGMTARARISRPASDRTVRLKNLGIEHIHSRPRVKSVSKALDDSTALRSLDRLTKVLVLVLRIEDAHNMAFAAFGHLATQDFHGSGGFVEKHG
jgi:hypothetical protein